MNSAKQYTVGIITSSDKGYNNQREDLSGPLIAKILSEKGYLIKEQLILPDEQNMLEEGLIRLADQAKVDLIITTGGTGFSPRDCTPEATLAVATRLAGGIAEAIRANSLTITKRAMLSRGQSVIRENTLIINLPGSPKAVTESLDYILDQLAHGLDILTENGGECARERISL